MDIVMEDLVTKLTWAQRSLDVATEKLHTAKRNESDAVAALRHCEEAAFDRDADVVRCAAQRQEIIDDIKALVLQQEDQ